MAKKKHGFTTRQIHAEGHGKAKNSHCQPIFQSSTFVFDSPEDGAALFKGEIDGHIYTRLGNPTTEALERTLASLEGTDEALAFSSGMAAIECAMLPFLSAGDHILAGHALYTSSTKIIAETFPKFDITHTFVDMSNLDEVRAGVRPNTRICLLETPANPTMAIADLAEVSAICHEQDIKVIVDNTFATPYNQRPCEYGVDIVAHSGTKYLNGHGDIVAGCVMANSELIEPIRYYRSQRGPVISPFDSFLFLRGLKTLSMRMDRHNENALRIARYLEDHADVETVLYPGLPSHPGHVVAKKQMSGFSGMLAFELKGGFDAAVALLKHTRLFILAVSLGTLDSLIQHPASMTHSSVPKEILKSQGLTESLIRVSVGCEDVADLIDDLEMAIKTARAGVEV